MGKILFAIQINIGSIIIEFKNRKKSEILFFEILYIPNWFTKLISNSKLLKKNYYVYSDNYTINS